MFFKSRKEKSKHSLPSISLPALNKKEILFNHYLREKTFVWNNQQINIFPASNIQKKAHHYIAIHTSESIFYVHNGISWLQEQTSIYIEHEDEETQDWLLQCAFERLPKNIFPLPIVSLSFHHYINTAKYQPLYLNGVNYKILYAALDDWILLFNSHRFLKIPKFNIEGLSIYKNILLGEQSLTYTDYKKLVCGNIILLNKTNFNLEGAGNIELGSFSMAAIYNDNKLIFQAWNNNMNDKPYKPKEHDDEWNQNDSMLNNNEEDEDEDEVYEEENYLEQYNQQHLEYQEHNEGEPQEQLQEESELPEVEAEENTQDIDEVHQQIDNIEEPPAHPFANVPIHLSFSLGVLRMPIAQIMQLQEGGVIELEKNTPAQVNILANSKLIGTGNIVEVDGKIAVQIIKLEQD